MFEKEAEEYADKEHWNYSVFKDLAQEYWQKGAEFGYNKKCEETFEMALSQIKHDRAVVIEENERLHAKITDLEAQIEKMKCCGNCEHFDFNEPNYCYKGMYREHINLCAGWGRSFRTI